MPITDVHPAMINKADVVGFERKTRRWICERNDNGGVVVEGGGYNERVETRGASSAAYNTDIVDIIRRISLTNDLPRAVRDRMYLRRGESGLDPDCGSGLRIQITSKI